MTGTPAHVTALWPDGHHFLTVELDPTSTTEHAVVHVAGEVDLATAPSLLEALTCLADQRCSQVDVRMRDVRFCDGSGLAVLLEARRRLAATGGGITLHDPCWSLRRILDICDLTLTLEARAPAAAAAGAPGRAERSADESDSPRLSLLPPLRDSI